MARAFQTLNVYPTYGASLARIVWEMAHGYEAGKFLIYKSPDGISDWQQIGQVENATEFVDPNLGTSNKLTDEYYKVIRQYKGMRNDSDVVGTFGGVTRRQFCAARYIMDLEFKQLRQFTPVLICRLKLEAPPCSRCTDPKTGQQIGISNCEVCYGTSFEGGYYPPIQSYLRISSTTTDVKIDRPDGAGTDDPVIVEARMMAFPKVEKGDLLITPDSDNRYSVDTVDYAYLAGAIPLIGDVKAQLLRRNDVRYKLKL